MMVIVVDSNDNKPSKETNIPVNRDGDEEKYIPPLDRYDYPLLSDFHGDDHERQVIKDMIFHVQHGNLQNLFGVRPDRSFLLYGPPGTGKTFAIKTVRNELTKRVVPICWGEYSVGQYGTAYINMGARNFHDFVKTHRRLLRTGAWDKLFLYIDEVDSVATRRGSGAHREDDKLVNTILTEIQEIHDGDEEIYMFFATNNYENLDPAFVRAGRIDRHIEFKLPSLEGLMRAYEHEIKQVNGHALWDVINSTQSHKLASLSEGLSYADVHAIVESAVKSVAGPYIRSAVRHEGNDIKDLGKAPHVTDHHLMDSISDFRAHHFQKGGRRMGFK